MCALAHSVFGCTRVLELCSAYIYARVWYYSWLYARWVMVVLCALEVQIESPADSRQHIHPWLHMLIIIKCTHRHTAEHIAHIYAEYMKYQDLSVLQRFNIISHICCDAFGLILLLLLFYPVFVSVYLRSVWIPHSLKIKHICGEQNCAQLWL